MANPSIKTIPPIRNGESEKTIDLIIEPTQKSDCGVFEVIIKGEEGQGRGKTLVLSSPRDFAFQKEG